MKASSASRSSVTMNNIWKVRGRRPTLRRTCKVFIPRNLRELDTLRLPATYEEDHILVQKLKAFTKHKLHHIILVGAISLYIYAGALLFQHLDSHCNLQRTINVGKKRQLLLQTVYNISQEFINHKSQWFSYVQTAVQQHEIVLSKQDVVNETTTQRSRLSIEESIFYCFTVITTIGYGNIAPCTDISRGITSIYAFIGVPFMILVLADLGRLFTKAMKFVFFYVRRFYNTGTFHQKASVITENKPLQYMTVSWRTVSSPNIPEEPFDSNKPAPSMYKHNQVTTLTIHNDDLYKTLDFLNPDEKNHKHIEVKDDFNLPVSFAITLVMIYMVVGGFLLSLWEDWTFFEGFYFVFISMTTIGFGDYVLKEKDYMLVAFAYLVFGLMLTSMCINVIREKLTVTFQKARVRIGNNTVLNVGALLEDEDHRSRMPQNDPLDSEKYSDCFGIKMMVHRDSVGEVTVNSIPTKNSKTYSNTITQNTQDDVLLKVPSKHRFTFYDSPYSTVQDENENSIMSLKKEYHQTIFPASSQL